jgi:nucleotide-binding universal stress UspA family protein
MGTRGLGALKGLFKNSVSTGVISLAHCPLLIVRGKHDEFPDSLRVGIAVDGSAYGEAAVRYTLKHRKLFGDHASFTIINAVNDYRGAAMTNVTGIALPTLSDKDIDQLEKNEFEDTVSKVRPIFAAEGITPDEVKLVGTPADEIAAYARANGIGILVMGSHGYNRLKTAVMGSTAAALAAHGIVPLLIVKSPKIEKTAVKTAEPAKA